MKCRLIYGKFYPSAIRKLRAKLNFSQTELATILGFSKKYKLNKTDRFKAMYIILYFSITRFKSYDAKII